MGRPTSGLLLKRHHQKPCQSGIVRCERRTNQRLHLKNCFSVAVIKFPAGSRLVVQIQLQLLYNVLGGRRLHKNFFLRPVVNQANCHQTPFGHLPFCKELNHLGQTFLLVPMKELLVRRDESYSIIRVQVIHHIPEFWFLEQRHHRRSRNQLNHVLQQRVGFIKFLFCEDFFGEDGHLVHPMALTNLFKPGVCKSVRVRLQKMCLGDLQLIDVQETEPIPRIIADTTSQGLQEAPTDAE